jgi:hypothetical protein
VLELEADVTEAVRREAPAGEDLVGEVPVTNPQRNFGTGSSVGLPSACASTRLNSAFVTGSGAARLYGPEHPWVSTRNTRARTVSSREAGLQY